MNKVKRRSTREALSVVSVIHCSRPSMSWWFINGTCPSVNPKELSSHSFIILVAIVARRSSENEFDGTLEVCVCMFGDGASTKCDVSGMQESPRCIDSVEAYPVRM